MPMTAVQHFWLILSPSAANSRNADSLSPTDVWIYICLQELLDLCCPHENQLTEITPESTSLFDGRQDKINYR